MKNTSSHRKIRRHLTQNNLIPILAAVAMTFAPQLQNAFEQMQSRGPAVIGEYLPQSILTLRGKMKRPYGMPPSMFARYIAACDAAHVSPQRVSQSIGYARASAGYHMKDGTIGECDAVHCEDYDYTTALDLSVRGLSHAQIRALLAAMTNRGFAPFFRDWPGNRHIHAVYSALPMKAPLRGQFHDFLRDRDGLKGHRASVFYRATNAQKQALRVQFLRVNPASN